jgi:hypothetical protein
VKKTPPALASPPLYSVITLPLGAITLGRFRKANPDFLERGAVETDARSAARLIKSKADRNTALGSAS